jgi:hypothetical protein
MISRDNLKNIFRENVPYFFFFLLQDSLCKRLFNYSVEGDCFITTRICLPFRYFFSTDKNTCFGKSALKLYNIFIIGRLATVCTHIASSLRMPVHRYWRGMTFNFLCAAYTSMLRKILNTIWRIFSLPPPRANFSILCDKL